MIKITYEDISNPLYNKRGVNNYILYLHKSPSDKYYVGITCQGIERRWRYVGRKKPQSAIDSLIRRNKERVFTEDTIKKMSKAVVQYDLNMNKISEFISGQEAFRKTGTDNSSITNC